MKRTIGIVAASLAALALGTGSAHAATAGPDKADKAAWKSANTACATVTDDVAWQDCVVGRTIDTRKRAVTVNDYHVADSGALILDHATRKIGAKRYKPSKADKSAMAAANVDCLAITANTADWAGCVAGAFASERGRYAIKADMFVIKIKTSMGHTFRMYLRNGSHGLA